MSSTYGGNSSNYPTLITIPSDGDAFTAASVNVPLEGLADRTAYLKGQYKLFRRFTNSTNPTEPPSSLQHWHDSSVYTNPFALYALGFACGASDIVVTRLDVAIQLTTTDIQYLKMQSSPDNGTTGFVDIGFTGKAFFRQTTAATGIVQTSMVAFEQLSSSGATAYGVQMLSRNTSGPGGGTVDIMNNLVLTVDVWRPL